MSNVVYGTYSTQVQNTTTTYATTNLTATITPFSISSKVKVEYHVDAYKAAGNVDTALNLIVYVGGTAIASTERNNLGANSTSNTTVFGASDVFVHSPATISATTYTLYFKSTRSGQEVAVHPYGSQSVGHIVLTEIIA